MPHPVRWPIYLSIGAAVITSGMKTAAYLATGSAGLLSDALESGVNLFAALVAYFSLVYSSRPADREHTYGHEKIEYLSSGLEGVLILLAGLGTAGYGVRRFFFQHDLEDLEVGVAIAVAAAAVNAVAARVLIVAGRKNRSIILEADGKHLMSDVWTTLGVVVGLHLVLLTGLNWIDSILAVAVGLSIVWTGGELILRSFNGLMDHALPVSDQEMIRSTIRAHLPEGAQFHALRTRQAGPTRFLEFHLLVHGDASVRSAHETAHRIEDALVEALPGLQVVIHIEPVDERESWESEKLRQLGEVEPPASP